MVVKTSLGYARLTQRHEILSRNTRDSKLSYGENQKSLSHLGSDRYRVVTDGQTNRRRELANTRYASSRAKKQRLSA